MDAAAREAGAGSGGPGKHRGGYGLIRAIRALRPAKLYFLDERHKTQPWGLYGGRAAQPNDAWLVRADGELIKLPSKFDDLIATLRRFKEVAADA